MPHVWFCDNFITRQQNNIKKMKKKIINLRKPMCALRMLIQYIYTYNILFEI